MPSYQVPPTQAGADAPVAEPKTDPNAPTTAPEAKPQPGQEWTDPSAKPAAERPSWLPEKFNTPEDMAKSYAELEAKMSGKPGEEKPTDAPKTDEAPKAENALDDNGINQTLQSHGLDLSTFTSEYESNGALSDKSYADLEKAGYPKQFVDQVISVRVAEGERMTSEVYGSVGGQETFEAVTSWATQNMPQSDLKAFNEAVDAGNLGAVKMMVQGMKSAFDNANGSDPKLVGGNAANAGNNGFENMRQMTTAMKDPRYGKDSGYDKWVDSMIKNASF